MIRITAQTVVVDGAIMANGADGYEGAHLRAAVVVGILLNVGTLSGSGRLQPTAAMALSGGAGGGGRVAVYYWGTSQLPTVM